MARQSKFECAASGRHFGMAAHLGRHMSTVHASKAKRTVPAVKANGVKRPSKTLRLGESDGLAAAVRDIQRYRDGLAAKRAALDDRMAVLDQALTGLGASAAGREVPQGKGRRGAGYRSGSLKAHIQDVLQARGGEMTVKAVTAAVRKAGFKSSNKALDKGVGNALAGMRSVTKIRRGVFRLR